MTAQRVSIDQPGHVINIIAVLLFLVFPAYLEFRAIQELRGQLTAAKRTRKIRGHVLWAIGLVLFFGLLILLVVISLLGRDWSWASPLIFAVIGLIFLGMFLGNQQIGRIRKKRLGGAVRNDRPTH